jgi:beta-glucosidase
VLQVKWWTTINEPWSHALGYEGALLAPGVNATGVGLYQAAHNMIKAHAHVYHLYDQYRAQQKGEVHFYEL